MKNNVLSKKIISALTVLAFQAGMVCLADEVGKQPALGQNVMPLKTVLVKFLLAMGWVGIALLILWLGLVIYNRFEKQGRTFSLNFKSKKYKHKFSTPETVEEATISFIKRNKL